MMRFFIFLSAVVNVVLGGFPGWTYRTTPGTCAGTTASPCGPEYWGQVPGCSACAKSSQSPIDISNINVVTNFTAPVTKTLNNGCNTWVQFSTNYTFELAFNDAGFVCTNLQVMYNSQIYTMKQIHFHSPSEHTIGGGYSSAEAHLVHQNSQGGLLVFGILLQAASDNLSPRNNSFFQSLWNEGLENSLEGIPTEVEDSTWLLNPYKQLFPARNAFYHYNGSLTTPPCFELVQWFVFDEPVIISQFDLKTLRSAMGALKTNVLSETGNNNRDPAMPLNGRTVIYVDGDAATTVPSSTNDDDQDEGLFEGFATASIVISIVSIVLTLALGVYTYFLNMKIEQLISAQKGKEVGMSTLTNTKSDNPMIA